MRKLVPREFERHPFLRPATVHRPDGRSSLAAQVFNLGQSGVAIFCQQSLLVGERVEIEFPIAEEGSISHLGKRDARITRTRPYTEGNILGIEFFRPLTADELSSLKAHWRRA